MSQENVEIVRRAIEISNRGDVDAILAWIDEFADPEVEVRSPGHLPDAGKVLRGREAAKSWWKQLLETFELQMEAAEFVDAGDAVVVPIQMTAQGRQSGAKTTNRMVQVYGFREGMLIYGDAYKTRREALEAAGLEE